MKQDILESYSLIFEEESLPGDIRAMLKGGSKIVSSNRFRSKIDGFVVEDSVNNVAFPMPYPVLDTSKIMLGEIYKRFRNFYSDGQNIILPWHYIVEFYEHDYVVHATRPTTHRFPVDKPSIKRMMDSRNQKYLNSDTESFMNNTDNIDISEMIHILVVGDSTMDVYTTDIYKKIGSIIIGPLARQNHISPMGNIHILNMGRKFNKSAVLPAASIG